MIIVQFTYKKPLRMMKNLSVFILICFVDISRAIVPEYCLTPLNMTDCKGPPTPVFYYYKPGSRCEFATWRGCHTFNMFPDEVSCSNTCIYKMYRRSSDENQVDFDEASRKPVKKKEDTLKNWEEELDQISKSEAIELGLLLDKVLEDDKSEIVKLIQKVTTTKVTTTKVTVNTNTQKSPSNQEGGKNNTGTLTVTEAIKNYTLPTSKVEQYSNSTETPESKTEKIQTSTEAMNATQTTLVPENNTTVRVKETTTNKQDSMTTSTIIRRKATTRGLPTEVQFPD